MGVSQVDDLSFVWNHTAGSTQRDNSTRYGVALMKGADILRVHDVREAVRVGSADREIKKCIGLFLIPVYLPLNTLVPCFLNLA